MIVTVFFCLFFRGCLRRDFHSWTLFGRTVDWSPNLEVSFFFKHEEVIFFQYTLKLFMCCIVCWHLWMVNFLALIHVEIHISCAEVARKSKQKGSSRALRRMKMLDSYLDRLLRCEAAVTQSTEVTQFFMPREQELHPDYTKNRLGTSP